MIYVTDTHPLIWFLAGDARLSNAAREALSTATASLIVPTIVLAQVHFLHSRRRVAVELSDIISLVATTSNMSIQPFDLRAAELLPTSPDIHDAMIVATATAGRCRSLFFLRSISKRKDRG